MKYVLLDYERKWKNDVFRMFYYMTNYLVSEFGYTLIDTSELSPIVTTTTMAMTMHIMPMTETGSKRRITDFLVNSNTVNINDMETIDRCDRHGHEVLVIENHDGKLLPDIFYNLDDDIKNNNVRLYLFSDDIHKDRERKKELKYYQLFHKIFVTYYRPFFELYPEFAGTEIERRVHWIPHCVSPLMNVDFNLNPISKIGLFGNTAGKVYPNRAYLKTLKEKNLSGIGNLIVEKIHPSKKYKPVDYNKPTTLVGQVYFDTLNKFLCNFTCSLTYGYVVCKYFEIPYTGSLLLCDETLDDLGSLGFKDMETCIIYKDRETIESKITWILDSNNREIIDRIRKKGYDLIRQRHTVNIRCQEIDRYLSSSN